MAECRRSDVQGTSERKNRFLLVVDGNANDLVYTAMLLQRLEYHVCTAKNAEEAFDMASVAVPALIVLSSDLPEGGSYALMKKLRNEPRTAKVPVVGLLGTRDASDVKRCRETGVIECLFKPVQAEALYRIVQAQLERTPRKNIRIEVRLPVSVNGVSMECSEGRCVSVISEHGMYIRSNSPSPAGSVISIEFQLADRKIAGKAQVLYSHKAGEGPYGEPGMGIKFTTVTAGDKEFIRQFISDRITEGLQKP